MRTALAAIVVMSVAAHAWSQGPAPEQPQDEQRLITRVYNVSDLVAAQQDYPAPPEVTGARTQRQPGRGRGGGGGLFGDEMMDMGMAMGGAYGRPATARFQQQELERLGNVIMEMIDPQSWSQAGGQSAIRAIGTSLIISQTEPNHQAIQELLDQLREEHGPMQLVGIRAYWALLDAGELRSILGERAERGLLPWVNLDALDELDAVQYRGQTACFSGQLTHITAGRGRTFVTDLQPVVGQNTKAYQPTTSRVHIGAVLQIRPLLSPDRTTAVLDIQSAVSQLNEADEGIVIDPEAPAAIDRMDLAVQQLDTTVRVPVGPPVLIGGMSREAFEPQLYLIIEVTAGE